MLRSKWWALVTSLFLLEACAVGPKTVGMPASGTLPERHELEIWSGGRAVTWHALVFPTDSITGVPLRLAPGRVTCRIALPRASVDSVREVHTDKTLWTTLGLVGGMAAVVLIVWNGQSD